VARPDRFPSESFGAIMPVVIDDRVLFRAMWALGSRRLRAGRGVWDAEGIPGRSRWVSAIVRLPGDAAESLWDATRFLRTAFPTHYYLPPPTMHVTLLNLDPASWEPDRRDRTAAQIAAAVRGRRSLWGRVRGLNLSQETVLAQILPWRGDLGPLRWDLRRVGVGNPKSSRLRRLLGGLAYANVCRFRGPVDPALVEAIRALRHRDFGEFTIREVEVVRTDMVLSEEGTTELVRFSFRD
jgi:hypothetical protein